MLKENICNSPRDGATDAAMAAPAALAARVINVTALVLAFAAIRPLLGALTVALGPRDVVLTLLLIGRLRSKINRALARPVVGLRVR